jgi:hypothetical protein
MPLDSQKNYRPHEIGEDTMAAKLQSSGHRTIEEYIAANPPATYEAGFERIISLAMDCVNIERQGENDERKNRMSWAEYENWRKKSDFAFEMKQKEIKAIMGWFLNKLNAPAPKAKTADPSKSDAILLRNAHKAIVELSDGVDFNISDTVQLTLLAVENRLKEAGLDPAK